MIEELPHRTVIVIDGDEAVRHATCALLESVGIVTRSYPNATAFLSEVDGEEISCIVFNVRRGAHLIALDFLTELHQRGIVIPAILTTSSSVTESLHSTAANLGAILFQKPYAPEVLIAHLRRVLDR